MKFRLLVDFEVVELMASLPRSEQLLLRRRFLQIQDFPGNWSDYREHDDVGRPVDISICGKYAITY
jgi:hypothetical protein